MIRLLIACLVAAGISACNQSSPVAPTPVAPVTPAAPTVAGLSITGFDALPTGFFGDYTATATLSNGTSQTVTPTWSASNGNATVESNGRVTGRVHGFVTLSASHQGATASKSVSIVNSYGGQWSGRYLMRACDQSGAFATIRYCQNLGGVGATGPITLAITQGGNDRTQLSGTISFGGGLAGNVIGNVTGDGRMVIGGSFTVTLSGLTFSFRVGGWESRLAGQSTMTGRWADNLIGISVTGNAYTENELQTMTRTSIAERPAAAPQSHVSDWPRFFSAMRSPS